MVVGWFNCDQWDDEDYRKKTVQDLTLDEAKEKIETQANGLSGVVAPTSKRLSWTLLSHEPMPQITNNYFFQPNRSICACWGGSMVSTGAVGVVVAVVGSVGVLCLSRNSLSFLKSAFNVSIRLP